MKLNMHIIKDLLSNHIINECITYNDELTLLNVKDIKEFTAVPDKDYLYFGEDCSFMNLDTFPENIVYYGTYPIEKIPFPKNCQILQIDTLLEPQAILQQLRSAFDIYTQWEISLYQALIQGESLQQIVDIGSVQIQNPFAILDSSGLLLAWGGHIPENYSNPIWNSLFQYKFPFDYDEKQIKNEFADNSWLKAPKATLTEHHYNGNKYLALTKSIYCQGEYVANLGMTEAIFPITFGQILLCSFFADTILSNYFNVNTYTQHSGNSTGTLLQNIISGVTVDPRILKKRIHSPLLQKNKLFYLFYIKPCTKELSEEKLSLYISWYTHLQNHSDIVTSLNGGLIIVTTDITERNAVSKAQQYLSFINPHSCAGISMGYSDFQNSNIAYIQAEFALKYLTKQPEQDTSISLYSKCAIVHMCDRISTDLDLNIFLNESVRILYSYDKKHNSMYLETAKALYKNAGNKKQTAQQLFLHRNTLNYRLQKISELLHRDEVFCPEELLHFLMSCQLLEYSFIHN